MKQTLQYILLLAICMVQPFIAFSQPEERIARFEDGKFVMTLDKRWNTNMVERTIAQYGLDSATVAAVFAERPLPLPPENSEPWKVVKLGPDRYEISKSLEGYIGANGWKNTWIADPRSAPNMQGPGYVDQSKVRFGYNRTDKRTNIQFKNGVATIATSEFRNAEKLAISGSFNNWDTEGIPAKRVGSTWEVKLKLEPGKYLYKFIADGHWHEDKGNKESEDDGFGGKNAVLYAPNHRFKFYGYADARQGIVSGSFNDWNEKQVALSKDGSFWFADVYLREGTYTYKFLFDKSWMPDPNNENRVPDGLGGENTVLSIGTPTVFTLEGFKNANQVVLTGDFNGWQENELKMNKTSLGWELPYVLAQGNYSYKYLVDGVWITDPSNPYTTGSGDYLNSFISKGANHTFLFSADRALKQVLVTGSFNGWDTENYPMIYKDGVWQFSLYLAPGKHHYKYIVDGTWITDPENPLYEGNEYGSENSVLWIDDQAFAKP